MGRGLFTKGIGVGSIYSVYRGAKGFDTASAVLHSLGSPVALDADGLIVAATSTELPNNTSRTYTTANIGTSPCDGVNTTWILDVPRNVSLQVTHGSSIVAMTCLVSGKDEYNQDMSELLTITATGTDKTAAGLKAFKKITSVRFTSAGNATTNTANLGWGDVLGLPFVMTINTIIREWRAGTVATAGTIAVAVTTDPATTTTGDVRGTLLPNAACNSTLHQVLFIPTSLTSYGVNQV